MTPTPLQLALARGHRWLAMLESGEATSLKEIAAREEIDNSYVSRMVNLTTLAPDIVAAILDDTLPNHVTLFDLAVDPPALWNEQRERAFSSIGLNLSLTTIAGGRCPVFACSTGGSSESSHPGLSATARHPYRSSLGCLA